jgi:cohesin loading factor subunit SCC2
MTSPGVDRRLTSEDCIDACITLIRNYLSKNIIHAISNTGHITAAKSKTKYATDPSSPKKQKKSPMKGESKEQRLMRSLKQVYKHIIMYSNLFLGLVEQMDVMIQSISLDDQPLLTLVTTALSVFAIEPPSASHNTEAGFCRLLHVASIGLITTIFQKYPKHRTIVIEDLFPLMLKLPSSRKSLRTFSIHSESDASGLSIKRVLFPSGPGQNQQCIQSISALILALVQCCVQMPTFQTNDEATKQLPTLKSGLGQCQSVCNFFASQLLQRCARKGEDGGASEYRPILGNLVEDLLLLLLSPDYPGSGMLLLAVNHILSNDVLKASSVTTKSSNSVESTYLSTAFDVLGKISATTARILAAYRAKPLKIASGGKENKSANKDAIKNSCHCGRPSLVHTFMVNCDSCHDWYHGECVGITKDNVSHVWICDDCRLRQMVVEETKAFAERSRRHQLEGFSGDSDGISDSHIFRQLLLNHLTEQTRTSNSPAGQFARQMHLAQWIEELGATKSTDSENDGLSIVQRLLCDHFLEQWDGPLASQRETATNDYAVGGSSSRCLNREGNVRLMLNLAATKSGLVLSFPRQLGLMIQLMADEGQVSMRKLSVKAISQVSRG